MIECTKEKFNFNDLLEIMALLRTACPWDKAQTHLSIRNNFLEEVYEVCDAIDLNDSIALCEELGDVMLQVVFHSEIAKNEAGFDINDVTTAVCKKLILRHPHIFGTVEVNGSEDVLNNWDDIKRLEKGHETTAEAMKAIAKALPALMRAEKVQAKAAKAGFGFESTDDIIGEVISKLNKLKTEISKGGDTAGECGDLLFAATNLSRFLGLSSENILTNATEKFIDRFQKTEQAALNEGAKF